MNGYKSILTAALALILGLNQQFGWGIPEEYLKQVFDTLGDALGSSMITGSVILALLRLVTTGPIAGPVAKLLNYIPLLKKLVKS